MKKVVGIITLTFLMAFSFAAYAPAGTSLDSILKKIGEEATETVIAAKGGDADELVYETADLWFHSLVLLVHQGVDPERVLSELQRRFGLSGLEEKAARKGS